MIKLKDYSSKPPESLKKKDLSDETKALIDRLGELHAVLMAEQQYAVLVIFQGMDGSGKDGAVRNVFDKCNPSGLSVYSFKKPTDEEFAHDFLWRVHKQTPAKGNIKIFNRSHYEDVLIQRVHGWIDEEKVNQRFDAINAFEDLIQFDNKTIVFKFYLHISFEQQEIELRQRLDEKDKHWKHNSGDWKEREHWDAYMRCYEDMLNRSRTPWTLVPVDSRWYRDYIVAKTMVETLEKLKMEYPPLQED